MSRFFDLVSAKPAWVAGYLYSTQYRTSLSFRLAILSEMGIVPITCELDTNLNHYERRVPVLFIILLS